MNRLLREAVMPETLLCSHYTRRLCKSQPLREKAYDIRHAWGRGADIVTECQPLYTNFVCHVHLTIILAFLDSPCKA
jgi:hypothetical protein